MAKNLIGRAVLAAVTGNADFELWYVLKTSW
jgi:hypothetical protein